MDCDDGLDDDADGAVDTRDVGWRAADRHVGAGRADRVGDAAPLDGSDRNGDGFVDSFTGTQPVIFQPVQHKPPYTKRELIDPGFWLVRLEAKDGCERARTVEWIVEGPADRGECVQEVALPEAARPAACRCSWTGRSSNRAGSRP